MAPLWLLLLAPLALGSGKPPGPARAPDVGGAQHSPKDPDQRGPVVEWVNVRAFGAKGDGISDDTVAIQSAIEHARVPGTGLVNRWAGQRARRVVVPSGRYLLSTELKTYAGVWIDGDGETSRLVAGPRFEGTAIIRGEPNQEGESWLQHPRLSNLGFESPPGSGIWAFQQHVDWIVQGRFENLTLWTAKGLDLSPYCQSTVVDRVVSYGPIDQLLRLQGNANTISRLDKEGETGSSPDPYVLVSAGPRGIAADNHLSHVIIEGSTRSTKSLVVLEGTSDTTLQDFWLEARAGATDGYALRASDSTRLHVRGFWGNTIRDRTRIRFTSHTDADIDTLELDANTGTIQTDRIEDVLEVDATSNVEIDRLVYGSMHGELLSSMSNIRVRNIMSHRRGKLPGPGEASIRRREGVRFMHNLLVNPSFETGARGWSASSGASPSEVSYVDSEVSPGLMAHLAYRGGSYGRWTQTIAIPRSWVGIPMTLSCIARLANASEGSTLRPCVVGAGLSVTDTEMAAQSGEGWQRITLTFVPQAAGRAQVGVQVNYHRTADAYLDECSLAMGDDGTLVGSIKVDEMQVGGATVTFLAAQPTAGTWKRGDVVFSIAPTVGRPKGWVCIAGGSPGTWASMGDL